MAKYFYNFVNQSFEDVKSEVKKLADLFLIKNYKGNKIIEKMGTHLIDINNYLEIIWEKDKDGNYPMNSMLALLEKEKLDELFGLLVNQSVNLSIADIQKDIWLDELLYELEMMSVVIGGSGIISPYGLDEFKNILFGSEKEEKARITATLSWIKTDEKNGYLFVRELLKFLSLINLESDETTWYGVFEILLILDVIYSRFARLQSQEREFILINYFYKAIALNLPVRKILRDFQLESLNMFIFANKSKQLVNALENNVENAILGSVQDGQAQVLSVLFSKCNEQLENKTITIEEIGNYLHGIISDADGSISFLWLKEACEIYVNLKIGKLVTWEQTLEANKDKKDIYDAEMMQLLYYAGFGQECLPEIIKYFKNKDKLVSLSDFLKQLSQTTDLDDSKILQNIMELSHLLQEEDLLKEGEDLIEYHEDDGKFYWVKK